MKRRRDYGWRREWRRVRARARRCRASGGHRGTVRVRAGRHPEEPRFVTLAWLTCERCGLELRRARSLWDKAATMIARDRSLSEARRRDRDWVVEQVRSAAFAGQRR